MNQFDRLTRAQKAAAILVAMGKQSAGRLLKFFKQEELKGLVEAARTLKTIPQSELEKIVGEFEDSALLTTFGRGGLGIFPAPLILAEQIAAQYDAELLGPMDGVSEQIHAISNERRIRHPAVELLCREAGRTQGV